MPPIDQYDHVVLLLDGNNNDTDDIAALPIAALLANGSRQHNKISIFYNNNLGEPNNSSQVNAMRKSAAFAEKLGIQTYDYQADINGTTNELIKILDSGDSVLTLQGGPMEAIYRGLEKTSPKNRSNITLITHGWGTFNQVRNVASRPGIDDVRTWKDVKNAFSEPTYTHIPNQNAKGNDKDGFQSSLWRWMDRNPRNPFVQEARDLMYNAKGQRNDASDAGMLYWALTGDKQPNPNDAEGYLAKNPPSFDPRPAPLAFAVEGEDMNLSGEYQVERNHVASGGQVISLRGGDPQGTGKAQFNFSGPAGLYDIKINYFDENDGVGTLELRRGARQILDLDLDKTLGSGSANGRTLTSVTLKNEFASPGNSFTFTGTEGGSEHVRIDNVIFTLKTEPIFPPKPRGDGLRGVYFDNPDLSDPRAYRTDKTIDFDWGGGRPTERVSPDTFSVRWEGFIRAEHSEKYTFHARTDDGVRLWVGGKKIIDDWTNHSVKTTTGTIALEADQLVPIKMEYYENLGSATAQLGWSSNRQPFEVVPQENLYTQPGLGFPREPVSALG